MPCRCPENKPGVFVACDNARTPFPRQWVWPQGGAAATCIPPELRHEAVLKLFKNRRIGLVGDSHLRKLYGYLTVFLKGALAPRRGGSAALRVLCHFRSTQ